MTDEGRILIIDDSWIILEKLKDCLIGAGYEVRTTTGPAGAARHLPSCDLAIVDFHMPGLNGDEVMKMLRTSPADSSCMFYLYTSDPEIASKYQRHGFDGSFLRKGDDKALVPQVNAVFRTIRMRKLAEKIRSERGR